MRLLASPCKAAAAERTTTFGGRWFVRIYTELYGFVRRHALQNRRGERKPFLGVFTQVWLRTHPTHPYCPSALPTPYAIAQSADARLHT